MDGIERAQFDHIGVVTEERHDGEIFVDTDSRVGHEPARPPVPRRIPAVRARHARHGPVRDEPHVAYRVADVHSAIEGHELLLGPFAVGDGFCQVAFVRIGGAVVEFMQYANPDEEGWF